MNSRKFAMNYGAVLGLCLVAIASVMWSFGLENGLKIPFVLNNGLIIIGIAYTIIHFRNAENNGFISYSESVKLGTSVAFFSSVILAFYTFIFISYIEPNILIEIRQEVEQSILKKNLDDEVIFVQERVKFKSELEDEDSVLEMVNKFYQVHWFLILGVLFATFRGFIYSLIISIFVKKDNPNEIA